MAMFGAAGRAASSVDPAQLSTRDKWVLFGSALKDAGAGFAGRDSDALLQAQAMLGQRQQQAAKQAFQAKFAGLIGGQAAQAAQQGPGMDGEPVGGASVPASPGLSINDPRMAQIAMEAGKAGVNIKDALEVLKAQQPNVQIGPDGTPYNQKDAGVLGRTFANRDNINGFLVNRNDARNEGRYFPKLPDGVAPDGQGGVGNLPGLLPAIGAQEQTTTTGRTMGTVFNRPNGDGTTTPMLGQQMFGGGAGGAAGGAGGSGRTQAPDDAAYAADTAKAVAAQYNGIQTKGQQASGNISNFNRINQLLDGFSTGKFTPAGKEIVKAASSLGIKVDERWGNVEAADALSKKLALDAMGGSLGAGFSNADRSFVEGMNPTIANTPAGRKAISAFGIARAQREQQVAQMARQWQQRGGRLDKPDRNGKTFFDYLDAYANANPLMKP